MDGAVAAEAWQELTPPVNTEPGRCRCGLLVVRQRDFQAASNVCFLFHRHYSARLRRIILTRFCGCLG